MINVRLDNVGDEIRKLRKDDPLITASEMGRRVGITREAVRQRLLKMELPTKVQRLKIPTCIDCSEVLTTQSQRCDPCRQSHYWVVVTCEVCSTKRSIRRSQYNRSFNSDRYKGHFFCSRPCFYVRNKKN